MAGNVSLGFKVALNMIEAGFDPAQATPEHFQALVEQMGAKGADWKAKAAFEERALGWRELAGVQGYVVRQFVRESDYGYRKELPRLAAEHTAVSGFIKGGDARQATAALDMIAATGKSSMSRVEKLLPEFHWVSIERERMVAMTKIALLKTLALEGRAEDGAFPPGSLPARANGLAEELRGELAILQTQIDARSVLEHVRRQRFDSVRGALLSLGEAVARTPGAAQAVADLLRDVATPEDRRRLLAHMLGAGSAIPEQRGGFARVTSLAKEIWAIDHGDAPFEPELGSHPVLGRLFPFAGQEVSVTAGGQTHRGELLWIQDVDPDKDGSRPNLHLLQGDLVRPVDLTQAQLVEAGGRVLFDSSSEPVPRARRMAQLREGQALAVRTLADDGLVGDYDIDRERVLKLAEAIAHEVPGAAELLATAKREGVPLDTLQEIGGAIVARHAVELLHLDLGPAALGRIAVGAFGATQRAGYKLWAMNVDELIARGAAAFRQAFEASEPKSYDLLATLQSGSNAQRLALLRSALLDLAPSAERAPHLSPRLREQMSSFVQ